MAFSDSGRLVFVSELDGVGVFDGQTLLLVK
jgi:hypothetical protein